MDFCGEFSEIRPVGTFKVLEALEQTAIFQGFFGSYLPSPLPCKGLRSVISTKPEMATPIRTMKAVW